MLRRSQVPVAKADIGPVTRRDVIEAKAIKEKDRHLGIVLAFNVKVLFDAKEESEISHIKLFEDKVIYSLIDNFNAWVEEDSSNAEDAMFAELTPISKFSFLKGMVFRNNNAKRVNKRLTRQANRLPYQSSNSSCLNKISWGGGNAIKIPNKRKKGASKMYLVKEAIDNITWRMTPVSYSPTLRQPLVAQLLNHAPDLNTATEWKKKGGHLRAAAISPKFLLPISSEEQKTHSAKASPISIC